MGEGGEWNVGQLTRQKFGVDETGLIGFTTYTGTVTATSNWNETAQTKNVRPRLKDSYESLFHQTEISNFFLDLQNEETQNSLPNSSLERAVGVIYRPETERLSHYFHRNLSKQSDGVIYFDKTNAVKPLDKIPAKTHEDAPETFPEGV